MFCPTVSSISSILHQFLAYSAKVCCCCCSCPNGHPLKLFGLSVWIPLWHTCTVYMCCSLTQTYKQYLLLFLEPTRCNLSVFRDWQNKQKREIEEEEEETNKIKSNDEKKISLWAHTEINSTKSTCNAKSKQNIVWSEKMKFEWMLIKLELKTIFFSLFFALCDSSYVLQYSISFYCMRFFSFLSVNTSSYYSYFYFYFIWFSILKHWQPHTHTLAQFQYGCWRYLSHTHSSTLVEWIRFNWPMYLYWNSEMLREKKNHHSLSEKFLSLLCFLLKMNEFLKQTKMLN